MSNTEKTEAHISEDLENPVNHTAAPTSVPAKAFNEESQPDTDGSSDPDEGISFQENTISSARPTLAPSTTSTPAQSSGSGQVPSSMLSTSSTAPSTKHQAQEGAANQHGESDAQDDESHIPQSKPGITGLFQATCQFLALFETQQQKYRKFLEVDLKIPSHASPILTITA